MTVEAGVYFSGGNIYLSAAVYDEYLAGLASVAVLERDDEVVLLPVRQEGAGGSMIKIVNRRGDRVIPAREVLQRAGVAEEQRVPRCCRWDERMAALRLLDPTGQESPALP